MRRHGEYYWYGAVAVLGCLPAMGLGCSEELGPERFSTTAVSGRVVVGGQPVGRGWVEFLPAGGTVGKPRSARLGPDGRFAADRVAVGWNRIGVVGTPLPPSFTGMFHPFASPIRRRIPPHPTRIELDLMTEARPSQRTQSDQPLPTANQREPAP